MRKFCVISISALAVAVSAVSAYPADDKPSGDDFITSSVTAVFDKVNQYTSGEKSIILDDWRGTKKKDEYMTDALGRRIEEPIIRTRPASSADKAKAADEMKAVEKMKAADEKKPEADKAKE
jgi:hypothetical protein